MDKLKKIYYLLPLIIALMSTGCLLPRPPGQQIVESIQWIEDGGFELITLSQRNLTDLRGNQRRPMERATRPERNLLFVAVDDTVQTQYSHQISALYETDQEVRLEDITWWRFAPQMMGLYHQVVKIPFDNFHHLSFSAAIQFLENAGRPFDIMLLTHGIPNHITGSQGFDFITYKDIAELGQLKNLRMVFMQGCFSSTLVNDWIKIGAREVMSYEGWNRNFFYIDFLIPALKKYPNAHSAWREVNQSVERQMRQSPFYQKLLEQMGLSLDEYFEIAPPPLYQSR